MGSRLQGRRIIITGAASGIGAATARIFHEEGARLALIDSAAEALGKVAGDVGALALPLDLTRLDAIQPVSAPIPPP